MLVLSRRKDESVVIGENIKIVVVDVRGDKVRLGIEAPTNVNVLRSEIVDKIRRANDVIKEEQAIDAESAKVLFSVNPKVGKSTENSVKKAEKPELSSESKASEDPEEASLNMDERCRIG